MKKRYFSLITRAVIGLLLVFPLLAIGGDVSLAPATCQTISIRQIKQDSAEIREQCVQAAKRGDAAGQVYVGMMYHWGIGVDKNIKEAIKWYKKAETQGYVPAQYSLGMAYLTAHTDKSFFEIAGSFRQIEQNYKESAKWFTKAAEQGYAPAQNSLGIAYEAGYGVPVDNEKSIEWMTKAAEQGSVEAQTNLAGKYSACGRIAKEKGETERAAKCFEQSIAWYKKAVEQENTDAYIGGVYEVMGDDTEAAKWYRKAAEQDKGGQRQLGLMYAEGRGVPQDDAEALKWMKMAMVKLIKKINTATKNEETEALYEFGTYFLEVKKDPEKAAKWLKRAAEQNHPRASYRLIQMYEDGRGVAKDAAEAEKWRKKTIELKSIESENLNAK